MRINKFFRKKIISIILYFSNLLIIQNDLSVLYEKSPLRVIDDENPQYLESSNNLICFKDQKTRYYFKECRKHTDFKSYLETIIHDYFSCIYKLPESDHILVLIEKDIRSSNNIKKLRHINDFVERNYWAIKNAYSGWNLEAIGLPTLYKEYKKNDKIVVKFLLENGKFFIGFIRNEIYAYNLNNFVKKDHFQLTRPLKSIATKKLADALNLEYLVPKCEFIKLKLPGQKERFGIVTKECKGACPLDLSTNERININPDFQRKLNNLNLFDALCFQRDHKLENYFVTFNDKKEVDGVIAFDNDSPMTFFPYPKLGFYTSVLCSPVIKRGRPNRPFVDDAFAEVIKAKPYTELLNSVRYELTNVQRIGLALRFWQLKHYVRFCQYKKKAEWSKDTIRIETNGDYGKTYLKHYLECNEEALIKEIMKY